MEKLRHILEDHNIYVYPRISEGTVETQFNGHPKIHRVELQLWNCLQLIFAKL